MTSRRPGRERGGQRTGGNLPPRARYHRVSGAPVDRGGGRCAVVDTFWQTETGGHVLTPLPGATPTKPGSACRPFFGVEPALLDEEGKEITGTRGER